MPGIKNKTFVDAAIDYDGEEEIHKRYCEKCMKLNTLSILQERWYLDDKGKKLPDPPDAEDWLQCWTCGYIVPQREAKTEGELTGIVEPVENPYDFGKVQIEEIDFKAGIKKRLKKKTKHPDSEVQKELNKGAELIGYSSN